MLKIKILFLLFIILLLPIQNIAQENKVTTGNENGTLIAIGGGEIGHTSIMKEFRKLAGGDSAKIGRWPGNRSRHWPDHHN